MSNYTNQQSNSELQNQNCSSYFAKVLNLMPSGGEEEFDEEHMRLFGVPLGVKRGRDGDAVMVDYDAVLRLQQPGLGEVKREPMDQSDS